MANLFTYFDGALPQLFTEMKVCWKPFLKEGTRMIRDRKLLEILKKDRTWLKYKLYSLPMVPRVLWYRGIYFVCSYALQRHLPVFLFIYS